MRKYFIIIGLLIVNLSFAQKPTKTYGVINTGTISSTGITTLNNQLYIVKDGDSLKIDMGTKLYPLELAINGAWKIRFDSSGNITTAGTTANISGVTISNNSVSNSKLVQGKDTSTGGIETQTMVKTKMNVNDTSTRLNVLTRKTGDSLYVAKIATMSTHIWTVGGTVDTVIRGLNKQPASATRYWSEISIPYNVTLTGISYLVGTATGGTGDSVVIQLCNSTGAQVATTRLPGHAAVKAATSPNTFQNVPFTSTYAATKGIYYVVVQFNTTATRFRAYNVAGSPFVAGSTGGSWGTKADITPGTSFSPGIGPICITY